MIAEIAAGPDHQVLVVALVEEQQVARLRVVDVLGHEDRVFLNQLERRHERRLTAIGQLPPVAQTALCHTKDE